MSVKLITHKPDHVIGLEIDGSINSEDIDRLAELMEKRFSQGEKLSVYAEVKHWSGMSLSAFIKDLRFSLQHLNDFEKEAIVSDNKWLEALAAFGNTLFSGIEVKHFTFEEKDRALAWVLS